MAGFTIQERRLARHHVQSLAKRHGISLVWVRSWGLAEAHHTSRVARIPRIERGRDYLIALHELGHIMSPAARALNERTDSGGELAREAWAWGWAAQHCLPKLAAALSRADWVLVGGAFGSYVRWHALDSGPAATLPPSTGTRPAAPVSET